MSHRIAYLFSRIVARLEPALHTDADLRDDIRALATALTEIADAAEPAPAPEEEVAPPVFEPIPFAEKAPPPPPPATLVWSNDPEYDAGESAEDGTATAPTALELSKVERRARLKAEACRWALERMDLLQGGAAFAEEIRPRDDALIARAKQLPNCFLWMAGRVEPREDTRHHWFHLAESYENLAEGLALIAEVADYHGDERITYERAVRLLAECQSAVREAVERVGADADYDQDTTFQWLRHTTNAEQIFVERHMRDADRAEPAAWEDRRGRIEACSSAFNAERMRVKTTHELFRKLEYHLQKLEGARPEEYPHHTGRIVGVIDQLVDSGLPPSNRELRTLLAPKLDILPPVEEPGSGYGRAIEALHRHLETTPVASQGEAPEDWSADVHEVRPLLAGRVIVLIGGDPRPEAIDNLKRAFDLAEVDWVASNKHQSYQSFRPNIARDEVAVVLLAIRWSSHSFANVKDFCDELGKPLVRLPSGYNPNQVAEQIIAQVSERLHA